MWVLMMMFVFVVFQVSPKIIYASRTHSQLSQAVQELKRSYYANTKTVVLGSRDVMCIHEEVSRLPTSSAKNMACQVRVKARSCAFYNNVAQKKEEMSLTEKPILDIEDLVTSGRRNRFCPFFMSREVVKKDADVIFMPYNYLLDPKLRATHGIDLIVSLQI
jgi:regulator of telomere elongation helicase 1